MPMLTLLSMESRGICGPTLCFFLIYVDIFFFQLPVIILFIDIGRLNCHSVVSWYLLFGNATKLSSVFWLTCCTLYWYAGTSYISSNLWFTRSTPHSSLFHVQLLRSCWTNMLPNMPLEKKSTWSVYILFVSPAFSSLHHESIFLLGFVQFIYTLFLIL